MAADSVEIDSVLKALSDGTRRAIVDLLRQRGGRSLFDICVSLDAQGFRLTRQGISRHLGVLASAGLVRARWMGRTKVHDLDLEPVRNVHGGWLRTIITGED